MVYLVGAGIGKADMISLRGLRCIQKAECIIYDNLIDTCLLNYAPENCQKIYVGKSAGAHYMRQDEINRLIVEKAHKAEIVVRLKGGDPYVFGRGGEEALCLKEECIKYEVIPGISSAIAGPCFAGIPVTHRDLARSLHVITAHTSEGGLTNDELRRYAQYDGTLVFLMGLSQVENIAIGLMAHGRSPDTASAVISHAGSSRQKTVAAPLCNIAEAAKQSELSSPAIIVVGETVNLRDKLNFFENLPLHGKRILLTRQISPEDSLYIDLSNAGAEVTVAPMIQIQPHTGALHDIWSGIEKYTHIVFTSRNAVKLFMEKLFRSDRDARFLSHAKLCSVGSQTSKELASYGLKADITAKRFSASGMLDTLKSELSGSCRVLFPCSSSASSSFINELSKNCKVDAVEIYDTVLPDEHMTAHEFEAGDYDAIVFASGSAVKGFDRAVGLDKLNKHGIALFSIGPSTKSVLADYGLDCIECPLASFDILSNTIIDYYKVNKS